MQQHSLLATKLYIPPVRPELVSRPRLIERLNAGLPTRGAFPRALTLVSAPAGFGKTTLVSEWVHRVGRHGDAPPHVAWLSLDEDDNDSARFLADPSLDAEIEGRQAVASLESLLSAALGVSFPPGQGTAALRARVARQVLVTDLLEAVGEKVPPALSTFGLAPNVVARETAAQLAQTWRNRRDLASSYVHWAAQVQAEIGPGSLDLDLETLARTETFLAGEIRLQGEVEKALTHRALGFLLDLAESRQAGFWSSQRPEIKIRWEVIADAGRVLVEAARIEDELKGKSWTAAALLSNYAYGASEARLPWCELDTAQRHLERDYHRFDVNPEQQGSLIQLVTLARQRYASVADRLAELFTRAYAGEEFVLPGVTLQADIFRETVADAAGGPEGAGGNAEISDMP